MGLAEEINFDAAVMQELSAFGELRRAWGYSAELEEIAVDGVSITAKDIEDAERIVGLLQPKLMPLGYRAFWSERHHPNGRKETDDVVVLKTTDKYGLIRARKTAGPNYDIKHEDVLNRLAAWESLCEFDIVGTSGDWIAIRFRTLPQNICAFAEEVYRFCPDTVDQGVVFDKRHNTSAAANEAKQLCPEVSAEMRRHLEQEFGESIPKRRGFLHRLFGSPTATEETEVGIRLLARAIHSTRELFLWWD